MTPQKIILGIHDVNPWGGQEKSNLEIFYRINHKIPIELHAYSFYDSRDWPQLRVIPYSQKMSKPSFLKFNYYQLQSLLKMRPQDLKQLKRRNNDVLIQSTGTALPIADIVQVQFVQKSWYTVQNGMPAETQTHSSIMRTLNSYALKNLNLLHEKLIYKNNKKFIAISHTIKKELMDFYHINSSNIHVIYHGVDTQQFPSAHESQAQFNRKKIRHEHNIPDDAFVITTVGALNARKGLHTILNVLLELQKNDIKNVALMAIGAGSKETFTNYAQKIGLRCDNLFLIPAQKDIPAFYQAADLFFFPTMYEPFGLVILEAMASGLPVLTSSVAGAAELITPGFDGLIIPNLNDTQSIANQITQLMKDQNKRVFIGENARKSCEKWTWDHVADEYLKFYESL